jgi:hypothetical protein
MTELNRCRYSVDAINEQTIACCLLASQCTAADLSQPEEKTGYVRIAPQIADVLREHKRPVVLCIDEAEPLLKEGFEEKPRSGKNIRAPLKQFSASSSSTTRPESAKDAARYRAMLTAA